MSEPVNLFASIESMRPEALSERCLGASEWLLFASRDRVDRRPAANCRIGDIAFCVSD